MNTTPASTRWIAGTHPPVRPLARRNRFRQPNRFGRYPNRFWANGMPPQYPRWRSPVASTNRLTRHDIRGLIPTRSRSWHGQRMRLRLPVSGHRDNAAAAVLKWSSLALVGIHLGQAIMNAMAWANETADCIVFERNWDWVVLRARKTQYRRISRTSYLTYVNTDVYSR